MEGPFTADQPQAGNVVMESDKKVLFVQGEVKKIKVIAFSSSSYSALQDTDFIVGFLRLVMAICARQDKVVIPLSTGEILVGDWHQSLGGSPKWLGRCVDLGKAHKQVPVHREFLGHGVLGFNTPHHLFTALRSFSFSLCFYQDKHEFMADNGAQAGTLDECVLR